MGSPSSVARTERGWPGHFICASRCMFRRNTLLRCGDVAVVVSTVGAMTTLDGKWDTVGHARYYETMVFMADCTPFRDADVCRQISLQGEWCIDKPAADLEADEMHEAAVAEIAKRIGEGEFA